LSSRRINKKSLFFKTLPSGKRERKLSNNKEKKAVLIATKKEKSYSLLRGISSVQFKWQFLGE
jgi:hypothetical protein